MCSAQPAAGVWTTFGFARNPYDTDPVPATPEGSRLLVGRDAEIAELTARLTSSATIPVLMGANGVGKTSVYRVAAFHLCQSSAFSQPKFMMLQKLLQLKPDFDLSNFTREVYYNVAMVLLSDREFLIRSRVARKQIRDLTRWLQEPNSRHGSVQINTPAGGIGGQYGNALNEAAGFRDSGLPLIIDQWLEKCFPEPHMGGVICLIDNLEVLRTSSQARSAIEVLRDGVLSMHGLRWVLCGTPTVVGGNALFSMRMEGRIANPTFVAPVAPEYVPELIRRRIVEFGSSEAYAPVDEAAFEFLYSVVKSRLRYALKLCQEYSLFLFANNRRPAARERPMVFRSWLFQQASIVFSRNREISPAAWRFFDDLCELGGEVRGKDINLITAFAPEVVEEIVQSLSHGGLIERSEMNDDDFLLSVTADGCLVAWQRGSR